MKVLSVAPRWVIALVVIAVVGGLVSGYTGFSVVGTFKSFLPREAMPSLERYEAIDGGPVFCSNGRVLLKVYYNEKGTNPENSEITAFYLSVADFRASKPWLLAVWPTDSDPEAKGKVYVDRDRDGKVDEVGDTSTIPNACNVQALDQHKWYRATPARNAGPIWILREVLV